MHQLHPLLHLSITQNVKINKITNSIIFSSKILKYYKINLNDPLCKRDTKYKKIMHGITCQCYVICYASIWLTIGLINAVLTLSYYSNALSS